MNVASRVLKILYDEDEEDLVIIWVADNLDVLGLVIGRRWSKNKVKKSLIIAIFE